MPRDEAEAVKWLRKAAEQGDALGQYGLGFMYANGHGVPRDDAEAAKWSRKAAEQGLASAQFVLGYIFENGRGCHATTWPLTCGFPSRRYKEMRRQEKRLITLRA